MAETISGFRKITGLTVSIGIVIAAIALGAVVLYRANHYPRTDDAEVLANFIGMAPQVEGRVIRLNVRDNQFVKEGTVLFEIDDRPVSICAAAGALRTGRARRPDRRREAAHCSPGQRSFRCGRERSERGSGRRPCRGGRGTGARRCGQLGTGVFAHGRSGRMPATNCIASSRCS